MKIIERIYRYKCDACDKETLPVSMIPEGWEAWKPHWDKPYRHRCDECVRKNKYALLRM